MACGLLLGACSSAGGTDHAQHALLTAGPSGYQLNTNASGPLSSSAAAAQATTADATSTHAALDRAAFSGGYSRVWTHDAEFVTILVLDFATPQGATQFNDFEVSALRNSGTADVVPSYAVPGGSVFVLTGQTRVLNQSVFCIGDWFASGISVVEVAHCAPAPVSGPLADQLAGQELRMLRGTAMATAAPT